MIRIASTAVVVVAVAAAGAAQARPLDVVFLIDTTGSMSGEINEAKDRVRQIAGALQKQRAPDVVRIGVVAYRDRSDDYLTIYSPLSPNVDKSFKFLSELSAGGGGDSPEDVLAGLQTVFKSAGFTDDDGVDRAVFLIGDAPAHDEYPIVFKGSISMVDAVQMARERRIVIHAVGCRSLPSDGVEQFRALAYGTEGTYQHIGRVDVGGATKKLDQAVLDALDHPAARRSVDVALEHLTAHVDDSMGIEVSRRPGGHKQDGSCTIEVSVPPGTELASKPRAALGADALAVTLSLTAGDGGGGVYQVSQCGAETLPLVVEIGGAS